MDKTTPQEQAGNTLRRLIQDNIIVAQECFHALKNRKKQGK